MVPQQLLCISVPDLQLLVAHLLVPATAAIDNPVVVNKQNAPRADKEKKKE
jgi:hypothetical protein